MDGLWRSADTLISWFPMHWLPTKTQSSGAIATLTGVRLIVAVTLTAGLAVSAPSAQAARVDARLIATSLVTPRERPDERVRLRSATSTQVRLRLLDSVGRTLAGGRSRARRQTRVVRLRLTAAGKRSLGRCQSGVVTLSIRTDLGVRRVPARLKPDPIRCAPLRWPPPALEAPRTIELERGFSDVRLDPGRDYVLRLPSGPKRGGAFIEGGRNVVLIGGRVSLGRGTSSDRERRALYFKNQTGTVHVEGVLIDGAGGGEGDGITLNAPRAVVQIENVRIVGLRGSEQGTHADAIQPWGGVRELRIDRLSASSHFQGLQLPVAMGPIGSALIRVTDLRALSPARGGWGGGHMLWLTPPRSCRGYTVGLRDVYVQARAGRSIANSVWPGVRDGTSCAAVERGGTVHWPGLPVRGIVRAGRPAGGDFVPRWNVGERYRSPGYAAPGSLGAAIPARRTMRRALACLLGARACAR